MNPPGVPGGRPPGVALLTTVDFWNPGSGHRARILSLARYLARHVELTVVFPVRLDPASRAAAAAAVPGARWHELALPQKGSMRDALLALAGFFRARPQRACIVEFLHLTWMRPAIPKGVLTLVDTHAVAHQHDADLQRITASASQPVMSIAQEQQALSHFDRVIAIAAPDAQVYADWLGHERVVLAPHAHPIRPLPLRAGVRDLLLVAGDYPPNHEGLRWFLDSVWPGLASAGLHLHVVGSVGPAMRLASGEQVHVHGVVPDLVATYAAADLCINPVRLGGGLKIKTIEALAHGRPFVSTSHGVRGLEDEAGQAFLVADTAEDFAHAVLRLVASPGEAARLAQAGLALAERRFGEDACYGPLLRVLRS
jgi:glycosyltransferase involved in cell wall biosynthesis